jgi:hypothetical protein
MNIFRKIDVNWFHLVTTILVELSPRLIIWRISKYFEESYLDIKAVGGGARDV